MSSNNQQKVYDSLANEQLLSVARSEFSSKSPADAWVTNDRLWELLARKGLIFDVFPEKAFIENRVPLPWNFMSDQTLVQYISHSYSGKNTHEISIENPHVFKVASQRKILPELIKRKVWSVPASVKTRPKRIKDSDEFIELLKEDTSIRNLAGAALVLNGDAGAIEDVILQVYAGKFKGRSELHQYLQENRDEIVELVGRGVTNLGPFIGEFSLANRSILPVLLGDALGELGKDTISHSLENKLVRSLQTVYSPRFNKDQTSVMTELESKIGSTKGTVQAIYQGLRNHYQEVMKLGGQLNDL
jgi:hypothetical protein